MVLVASSYFLLIPIKDAKIKLANSQARVKTHHSGTSSSRIHGGRLGASSGVDDSEVARSLLGFLKFLDVPFLPDGSDFLCWFKVLRELNFFFRRSLNSDNLSIFIIRQ